MSLFTALLLCISVSRAAFSNSLQCAQIIDESAPLPAIETDIPIDQYRSANMRTQGQYEELLGPKFTKRFRKARRVLDVGGGYGLAVLKRVQADDFTTGVVINAQDAWKDVTASQPTPPYLLNSDKLVSLAARAGVEVQDVIHIRADRPIYSPDWDTILRARFRELFSRLNNRFVFSVGLAQVLLPTLKTKFDVITDLFGAYYYTKDRLEILDEYYSLLADRGCAFIVIGSTDFMFNGNGWKTYDHEPENKIHLPNRNLNLAGYLVLKYPSIFRVVGAGSTSGSLTKVLIMKKDSRIAALHLRAQFNTQLSEPNHDDKPFSSWRRRVPDLNLYPTGGAGF